MKLTKHSSDRMQQRGIPPLILNWLFDYGRTQHDGNGATIIYFDKAARRDLERQCGRPVIRRLSSYLDCYAVVAGGHVVTAGKRYKRIKTH